MRCPSDAEGVVADVICGEVGHIKVHCKGKQHSTVKTGILKQSHNTSVQFLRQRNKHAHVVPSPVKAPLTPASY